MGFWKELGKVMGEAAGKLGDAMAEDLTYAYNTGKAAGRGGIESGSANYRRAGYKPEWLEAYNRGYIAGCDERRRSGNK